MTFRRIYLTILGMTAINYAMMLFFSLPVLVSEANGLWPFDARIFGYSVEQARIYISTISNEGLAFYLTTQSMLDFSFPALYALSLILTFYHLAPKLPVLYLLPLAAALFDYYENATVTRILLSAEPEAALVGLASLLTQLKYAAIALSLLAILWLWLKGKRDG